MSGRPPEEACAEVAANSYRSGQVEALMWMQAKLNGHLTGGQPLVPPNKYQDDRPVAALLASVRDRIREVQP